MLDRLARRARRLAKTIRPFFRNEGHCPVCNSDVTFVALDPWLRDNYLCAKCGSLPRERALMHVIETRFPHWRGAVVHESSPARRGASARLSAECRSYIPSQYFPDATPGSIAHGVRCENLEALTFDDESIDLHVTQDVMEHVFHPDLVWREIARTLRPNGVHIFTVPLVNKSRPTVVRAEMSPAGDITHVLPPQFHANPISRKGSLVTMDWGYDICDHIFRACGLPTQIISLDDMHRGIRAEYNEVLMTLKPGTRTG